MLDLQELTWYDSWERSLAEEDDSDACREARSVIALAPDEKRTCHGSVTSRRTRLARNLA
jgi:hypothetical protein